MTIHFVCRGNVLRSLIAEAYLNSLNLDGVIGISSGVRVDLSNEAESQYFTKTIKLLDGHGIKSYVKQMPDQLTQERVDSKDITVCMNQRVADEASLLVRLPKDVLNWNIIDVGEGMRTDRDRREVYIEEIYNEITAQVDELAKSLH